MHRIFAMLRQIAPTRTTVLVVGESGTGKELVARALHELSPRSDKAFVAVNCGAIPETLLESELFGHAKGAFTGAISDKKGLFEAAHGGTLLLDEIAELPLAMQVKLLRVLQERRIKPVGALAEKEVDVRVVAATNRDLEVEIDKGTFRQDLYYRLNVIQVRLPPLRERRDDIALLADHFVRKFSAEHGRRLTGIDPAALSALTAYAFPGNVRELENIIERAVTLSTDSRISKESLPPLAPMLPASFSASLGASRTSFVSSAASSGGPFAHQSSGSEDEQDHGSALPSHGINLEKALEDYERHIILQALEQTSGNRTEAARLLSVSFRSMRYRLSKLGISPE